jgi:hypothetical protein
MRQQRRIQVANADSHHNLHCMPQGTVESPISVLLEEEHVFPRRFEEYLDLSLVDRCAKKCTFGYEVAH